MAMPRLPAWMFSALWFGGIAILLSGGVRYQVKRKTRTSLADKVFLEDSLAGNSTRYRVLAGRNDTGGEFASVEALLRRGALGVYGPGRPGALPAHYHAQQDERVEVKAGVLGYWIGDSGAPRVARAGDVLQIRRGEAHVLWNAGGGAGVAGGDGGGGGTAGKGEGGGEAGEAAATAMEGGEEGGGDGGVGEGDLLIEMTWAPARHGEAAFETLAGLGQDYESILAVGPAQRALTLAACEWVLTDLSPGAWELFESLVAPALQRVLGYAPFYTPYASAPRGASTVGAARAVFEAWRDAGWGGAASDDDGDGDGGGDDGEDEDGDRGGGGYEDDGEGEVVEE